MPRVKKTEAAPETPAAPKPTTRVGYVALIGRPNVGKSTLLNRILGKKVAITSDKPQTTRLSLLGIRTTPRGQIVFIDNPGIHKPLHKLNKRMMNFVQSSLQTADLVCLLVDATERFGHGDEFALEMIKGARAPIFLLINKVDIVKKENVLLLIDKYKDIAPFKEIIPLSALRGTNVDVLEKLIFDNLPLAEKLYGDEDVSDQSERFLLAEIIREKVLDHVTAELPWATAVYIEQIERRKKEQPRAGEGEEKSPHAPLYQGGESMDEPEDGEEPEDLDEGDGVVAENGEGEDFAWPAPGVREDKRPDEKKEKSPPAPLYEGGGNQGHHEKEEGNQGHLDEDRADDDLDDKSDQKSDEDESSPPLYKRGVGGDLSSPKEGDFSEEDESSPPLYKRGVGGDLSGKKDSEAKEDLEIEPDEEDDDQKGGMDLETYFHHQQKHPQFLPTKRDKKPRLSKEELRYRPVAYVKASIFVERDNHRKIIIGRQGKVIKLIGIEARREIEEILDAKVYLELQVKVRPDWRDSADVLDLIEGQKQF